MLIKNKTGIIQQQYRLDNGLIVNQYSLVFPNGFHVGEFRTPFDGQVTEDLIMLDIFTAESAKRWGIIPHGEFKIKGKTR